MGAPSKKTTRASAKKRPAAAAKKRAPSPKPRQPIQTYDAYAYLVKSEPFVYSFANLVADKKTSWDGVRNYEARNTLRAMKKGDTLLFYHSNEGKEVVGLARVTKEAFQDPTTTEDWSSVEIAPLKKLKTPVTLATIKADPLLSQMLLVRRSRISVVGVTKAELERVLELGGTTI